MARIGVIGLGAVGSSVLHGMSLFHSCSVYDIIGDYELNDVLATEANFGCVPTPGDRDGRLDCSAVDSVLDSMSNCRYKGIVVIKSTVRVGYMNAAEYKFPGLRLVYMPEFLREKSRFTWFLNPDRLVVSGKDADVEEVLSLFHWVKNAAIIRADHRSAELGKLAHNAFIATKVSFTNTIELISDQLNADPCAVMKIVTSDRRVGSTEHMRPGIGAYGGKCVPKDTSELISATANTDLLRAVQSVRNSFKIPGTNQLDSRLLVIIATKDRSVKLRRALQSISVQSRRPDKVIVVSDCNPTEEIRSRELIESFRPALEIEFTRNSHAPNVSGALNTGIDYYLSTGADPGNTFLALLDDDDWWERMYLANLSDFARETGSDWIVSGIIRHDQKSGKVVNEPIPVEISVGDFLVGNPNIQGSNLFVRLSKLIQAGMFDEALPSTTDRDVCIRLLEVPGIRYEVLRNHLMHHDASLDNSRLSSPSSQIKKAGLEAFYEKYRSKMTEEQKSRFKERAMNMFGINIDSGILGS